MAFSVLSLSRAHVFLCLSESCHYDGILSRIVHRWATYHPSWSLLYGFSCLILDGLLGTNFHLSTCMHICVIRVLQEHALVDSLGFLQNHLLVSTKHCPSPLRWSLMQPFPSFPCLSFTRLFLVCSWHVVPWDK